MKLSVTFHKSHHFSLLHKTNIDSHIIAQADLSELYKYFIQTSKHFSSFLDLFLKCYFWIIILLNIIFLDFFLPSQYFVIVHVFLTAQCKSEEKDYLFEFLNVFASSLVI